MYGSVRFQFIELKVLKRVRFHMFWSLNSTRSRSFKGGGRQKLPYGNTVGITEQKLKNHCIISMFE